MDSGFYLRRGNPFVVHKYVQNGCRVYFLSAIEWISEVYVLMEN